MLDQPESYKVDVTLKSEMPRDDQQVPQNPFQSDFDTTPNKSVKISKKAPKRPIQEQLRYPYDILNEFTDYLQINIVEYTSSGKRLGAGGIRFDDLVGSPGSRKSN